MAQQPYLSQLPPAASHHASNGDALYVMAAQVQLLRPAVCYEGWRCIAGCCCCRWQGQARARGWAGLFKLLYNAICIREGKHIREHQLRQQASFAVPCSGSPYNGASKV